MYVCTYLCIYVWGEDWIQTLDRYFNNVSWLWIYIQPFPQYWRVSFKFFNSFPAVNGCWEPLIAVSHDPHLNYYGIGKAVGVRVNYRRLMHMWEVCSSGVKCDEIPGLGSQRLFMAQINIPWPWLWPHHVTVKKEHSVTVTVTTSCDCEEGTFRDRDCDHSMWLWKRNIPWPNCDHSMWLWRRNVCVVCSMLAMACCHGGSDVNFNQIFSSHVHYEKMCVCVYVYMYVYIHNILHVYLHVQKLITKSMSYKDVRNKFTCVYTHTCTIPRSRPEFLGLSGILVPRHRDMFTFTFKQFDFKQKKSTSLGRRVARWQHSLCLCVFYSCGLSVLVFWKVYWGPA
jgi:hypothetical protein